MQGKIQKWVDQSISVTINLPNDVSEDLVNKLYVEAWKSGCKGCTVYRDGSRSGVLVSTQKTDKKEKGQKEKEKEKGQRKKKKKKVITLIFNHPYNDIQRVV